jgi:hypothetical protein
LGTISSHVTGTTANATNDVGSKVTMFRTIVFPMTDVSTVLAELIFVVAKCAVEGSEFTKLVAFVIIFALRG